MRAAILRETDAPLTVEDVELAAPGPGEVTVGLAASGVCHSDWNVITGATPNPLPAVLGHEGAGVVEQVGEGVAGLSAGDHVILSWLPACGTCFDCVQGRGALCEAAMADIFGAAGLRAAALPAPSLPREEKVVTGSFYGSCRPHVDMPLVVDLCIEGRLDLDALVTRHFTLDEINDAFAAVNAGEVARGVIRF